VHINPGRDGPRGRHVRGRGTGRCAVNESSEIVELLGPTRLVQRVADQAMQVIPGAEGALIGFSDGHDVTCVSGAGYLLPYIGTTVDLEKSLSGLSIRTRQVLRCDDTNDDLRVDVETCRRLGVASSVCVPLCRGTDTLGVMVVGSSRPNAFSDDDVTLLERLADFMSIAVGLAEDLARVARDLLRLGPPQELLPQGAPGTSARHDESMGRFMVSVLRPDALSHMEARKRTEFVLDHPEMLNIVFQPIVRVATKAIVGVEALARFNIQPVHSPDHWFAEAHRAGLGIELEMLAITKALEQLDHVPRTWYLTCNVGPETIVSVPLAELLSTIDQRRVVMELTEHSRVTDYPALMTRLRALREPGTRLAIDDTGAGFSSLSHVLKLAPDFIKLDRDLVAGIDFDPVRRVLAASLVDFAMSTGAEIVAEGVEIEDELRTLEYLGVRYAQGYHAGPAADLDSLVRSALAAGRDARVARWPDARDAIRLTESGQLAEAH